MDTLIIKIMNFAQKLVDADRASLFLVDAKTNQLYARIFDIQEMGKVFMRKLLHTGWSIASDCCVEFVMILFAPPSVRFCFAVVKLAKVTEQVGDIVEYHRSGSTKTYYQTRWSTFYI